MSKVRKKVAKNWARNFASGLLENQEVIVREHTGLTYVELVIAQDELRKLAVEIQSKVNQTFLPD